MIVVEELQKELWMSIECSTLLLLGEEADWLPFDVD